ncbi:MAG: Glycosyltransferase-like protein [Ignavibacteriae bacterium]|nr:MAG: Glycosyltransferase-like protein [Ignavibacteriota bacterium]
MSTENNDFRNLLVIAYYFPPMGLSGVQRTQKFVKYLPQFGWRPTVITVTPTGYFAQDYTLLDELKDKPVEIVRVGSLDPNRLFKKKGIVKMPSERVRKIFSFLSDMFFIPDNKIGWKKNVLKKVGELLKNNKYSLVFSTAPPFTDFIIAYEIFQKYKIPYVLDYRDAWLDYPLKYYPTPIHKYLNYRYERDVLHSAKKIITTNRKVKELILKKHKFLEYNDIDIVPQGFDPEDFVKNKPAPRSPVNKMRITHAGVFYGNRTPKYFFLALQKLLKEKPELMDKIEVYFIGNFKDEDKKLIDKYNLGSVVRLLGYLDHQKCIQYLMSSDLLWLMLDNETQSPGKVYEYIGAHKPILANVPDGFIKQTLEEFEYNTVLPPFDVDGTKEAIYAYFEKFQKNQKYQFDEDKINAYNRVQLTNKLANILGFALET